MLVLAIHAAATWALVGLIWFIQLNHYPLFAVVGARGFPAYQRDHMTRTTWVVAPLMGAEALTAAWLLWMPPEQASVFGLWLSTALLAVIWLSTVLVQVPLHRALLDGFDAGVHRRLVRSNWLRTTAWTLRGVFVLTWLPLTRPA